MIDVRLTAVSKRFDKSSDAAAVDDVTVTIGAGEFFTLLGPSGCGKTTTLRMVAGFYFPTSGQIHFGDDDVTHLSPNKRDTGMVFQNYALFPHMTVAQNVAYGLRVRRVSRAERDRRVEEALAQVHLSGYGARRIDALSGGQQQRVALARALVIRPRTLLLDEPLSNLDAKLREETRTEIRRIQRESGNTAIYVTHDQAEAMAMSDRIAVMQSGKVQQVGSPQEIYYRPANAFVARFIGRSNVLSLPVAGAGENRVEVRMPDGTTLEVGAAPGHGLTEGDTALVSVRPEHITIAGGEDEPALRGRVTHVEFTGMATNLTVDADGTEVMAAVIDAPSSINVGDLVGLRLVRERLWVVKP
ncbi:ABC transporter ATP-binding protein [Micromonospora gifhornensis]|uniref:Spermidine/putrescine ABC transporter ATP-binding protein n=1 Tax=Micromonospora gifhornensis TaxID=84594 RepID=A0ABQ4I825_9ACTN|nr:MULTISPECIES: ABC transporter ATP-binding protein [Micromonospora]PMR62237.1 spermidine/putrescine ABC transporter ATP-binding protein [Verrucosispora sp. ts21]GIJ14034.1 spermidine/putrescine ABC transporter ATP-binding protein [Micromonospora gifhornensis]